MFYSSFFTIAFAGLLSLHYALAVPLDTRIGDGSQENKKIIQDTMPTVNQRIENMEAVANLPEDQAKKHLAVVKAFGSNANIGEIRKTVDTLKTSRITVPHTDAEPHLTQGGTKESNGHVTFGQPFYSSDTNTRAGTIIHEATHAKSGTVDAFDKNGHPYDRMADIPKDKVAAGVQIGYKDSHLDQLKDKHSDQMHRNADSYRVFSEECPNVRRSLYRRAMAEPHPVIRSQLLRRAATACAWKPKSKPANSHVSNSQKPTSMKKPTDGHTVYKPSKPRPQTNNMKVTRPSSKSNKNSNSRISKARTSKGPGAKKGIKSYSKGVAPKTRTPRPQKLNGNKLGAAKNSNIKSNSRANNAVSGGKGLKSKTGTRNSLSAKTRLPKSGPAAKKLGKLGSSAAKLSANRPKPASLRKGLKSGPGSKQLSKSRSAAAKKPTSQKSLKANPSRKSVKTSGAAKKPPGAKKGVKSYSKGVAPKIQTPKPLKLSGSSARSAVKKSTKASPAKKITRPNSAARKSAKNSRPNSVSRKPPKSNAASKKLAKPQGAKKLSVNPASRKTTARMPNKKPLSGRPTSKRPVSKAPTRRPATTNPVAKKSSSNPASRKPATRPAAQKSQVKRPAAQKPAARPRPAPPRRPAAKQAAQKPAAKPPSKAASKPAPKPGKGRK